MNKSNRLGLGTVQFGLPYGISNRLGQPDKQTVTEILDLARSYGMELLDTANAYGTAELVLGSIGVSDFKVVSKYMPPESYMSIDEQLHNSLGMLKCDSLYGYLSHRPQNILKRPEQWEALQQLKTDGFVEKIGYSLNEPAELDALLELGMIPDLIQIPVNYFDRRFISYLDELKSSGTEIHARSVFLQGLFFLKEFTQRFDPVKDVILGLQARIDNLPASLLNHVLMDSRIDHVVIGIQNPAQLTDIIQGLDQAEPLPELAITVGDEIVMPSKWSQ